MSSELQSAWSAPIYNHLGEANAGEIHNKSFVAGVDVDGDHVDEEINTYSSRYTVSTSSSTLSKERGKAGRTVRLFSRDDEATEKLHLSQLQCFQCFPSQSNSALKSSTETAASKPINCRLCNVAAPSSKHSNKLTSFISPADHKLYWVTLCFFSCSIIERYIGASNCSIIVNNCLVL